MEDAEFVDLTSVITRVVGAAVRDPHEREDLVQEALTRILERSPDAHGDVLLAYGVVTARSVASADR